MRQSKDPPVWTEVAEMEEGGWSGDILVADYEDVQESEAAEIYVQRCSNQKT